MKPSKVFPIIEKTLPATAADVLGLMERVDYKDNIRDKKKGG